MNVNGHYQPVAAHVLRRWELRQKFDGYLVMMMVFMSLLPVVNFVSSPGVGSACVMGLFLVGLGVACARLVISAAKVVEIHHRACIPQGTLAADILSRSETQWTSNVLAPNDKSQAAIRPQLIPESGNLN
jgi:hypothetical protein